MIRLEKTIVAGSMALLLAGTSFFMPQNKAMAARTIKIDGNPSEWDGITAYKSNDSKIAKWWKYIWTAYNIYKLYYQI